jgi:NMD protein affecting ribosome stability and mRNA decay
MALYYFDTYDGGEVVVDVDGLEFPNLETVKVEAARGLADLARDVLPGSVRRELAIVVRDEESRHVMKTVIIFEIQILISN